MMGVVMKILEKTMMVTMMDGDEDVGKDEETVIR